MHKRLASKNTLHFIDDQNDNTKVLSYSNSNACTFIKEALNCVKQRGNKFPKKLRHGI